jgi:hypothetical protein
MTSSTFWSEQKTQIETQLAQVRSAISALLVGGVESYQIDDGQSRQSVTKLDIDNLHKLETHYLGQLKAINNNLNPDLAKIGVAL